MAASSTADMHDQCAVCHSDYQQPRLLECLHSFCHRCLLDRKSKEGHNHIILCPICKAETVIPDGNIAFLPSNDALQARITRNYSSGFNKQDEIVMECQTCLNKVAVIHSKCDPCGFICGTCEGAHRNMIHVFQTHRVECLRKCIEHPHLPLAFYCNECSQVICIQCRVSKHSTSRNHNVISLAGSTASQRKLLQDRIPELKQVAKKLEQLTSRVHAAKFMSQVLLDSDDYEFINLYPIVQAVVDELIQSSRRNGLSGGYNMKEEQVVRVIQQHPDVDIHSNGYHSAEAEDIPGPSNQPTKFELIVEDENKGQVISRDVLSVQSSSTSSPLTVLSDEDFGSQSQQSSVQWETSMTWHRVAKIGKKCTNGNFVNAGGVSVNPTNGDIAVADHTRHRVDVFTQHEEFKMTIKSKYVKKHKHGYYYRAEDVAFNSYGHLFVVDQTKNVQRFSVEGSYLNQFSVLEKTANPRTRVCFSCIDIDPQDNIYVGDCKRDLVSVFTDTGKHIRTVKVSVSPMYLSVNEHMEVLVTDLSKSCVVLSVNMSRTNGPTDRFEIANVANVTGIVWDKKTMGFFVATQQDIRGNGQVHYHSSTGQYVKTVVTVKPKTKLNNPLGLALSPSNVLVVADLFSVKLFASEEPEEFSLPQSQ